MRSSAAWEQSNTRTRRHAADGIDSRGRVGQGGCNPPVESVGCTHPNDFDLNIERHDPGRASPPAGTLHLSLIPREDRDH